MTKSYANPIFNKIKPEKKERIIQAAIIEFADFGLSGANINNIAKKADVSVGSLYKYFANKEDLFLYIVSVNVETMQRVQGDIIALGLPLIETIESIINAIFDSSEPHAMGLRFYNVMTTEHNNELVRKIAAEMEGNSAMLYSTLIKKEQEKGTISKELNAHYAAFFIDNLFMQLQFSLTCEYYRDRLRLFVRDFDVTHQKEMVEQLMVFIKNALQL